MKNTASTDLRPDPDTDPRPDLTPERDGRLRRGLPNWVKFPLFGILLGILLIAAGPFLRIWTGGILFGKQITRPPLDGRTNFNVLVLGLDQPDKLFPNKGRRSDTVLLAHVDLTTKMVTGVSIPRDTRVHIPEEDGWVKINKAYETGGPQESMAIVSDITGVVPDYYVVVDTASTKQLVDMVGGVDIDVDERMKYDDNWQDLHIDLQPGPQHLDGTQAVGYVRFRHDALGDINRMRRQQKFIRAMAQRLVAPANLPKLPWIVPELRRQVQTNMGDADLLYLANAFRSVPSSHLEFTSLEGESRTIRGASFYLPYDNKMKEAIAKAFPGAVVPDSPNIDTIGR